MHPSLATGMLSPEWRTMLVLGVLGGFTTYSGFNFETLEYLREGAWSMGLVYVVVMVGVCLAAGVTGLAVARAVAGK